MSGPRKSQMKVNSYRELSRWSGLISFEVACHREGTKVWHFMGGSKGGASGYLSTSNLKHYKNWTIYCDSGGSVD